MERSGRGGRGSGASLRLAEVVAALSLATDLGTGQPWERALRTCLLALRLGKGLGLAEGELATVLYVALLRFVGCTTDMRALAALFGVSDATHLLQVMNPRAAAEALAGFLLRHPIQQPAHALA